MKKFLIIILTIAFLVGGLTLAQAISNDYFAKFSYKISSYDEDLDYDLIDLWQNEDGKTVYKVNLDGKTVKVQSATWDKYMGSDYGSVTCHIETIAICKNSSRSKSGYSLHKFIRVSYPWDEPAQPFTEDEAKVLLDDIYKNEGWNHGMSRKDSSVSFSESYLNWKKGICSGGEELKRDKRNIEWWWLG